MINEKTLKLLMNSNTFRINSEVLASTLHISKQDASQELSIECYTHRFKEDFDKITPEIERSVTFARKQIQRKYYNQVKQANDNMIYMKPEELENLDSSYALTENSLIDDLDQDEFVAMLECFQKQSREFVAYLLLGGKAECKQHFYLDEGHFNERVNRLIKYVEKHRDKFRNTIKSNYTKEIEQQIDNVEYLIGLINNDVESEYVGNFILEHQEEPAFLESLDKTRYQVDLMTDWDMSIQSRKDGYKFIDEMYNQRETLKKLIMK